jgi:hypothetical protein
MGGGEIFEVFVVGNNFNWDCCSLKEFSLNFKHLMDGLEFLVMCIVIEFHGIHGPGVESYRVYLTISRVYNCGNGIIQSVHFDDDRNIQDPMQQDQGSGELILEFFECCPAFVREMPNKIFLSESG